MNEQQTTENNKPKPSEFSKLGRYTLYVIGGFGALFIAVKVLDLVDRIIYDVVKAGLWLFTAYIVIAVILSVFKKNR